MSVENKNCNCSCSSDSNSNTQNININSCNCSNYNMDHSNINSCNCQNNKNSYDCKNFTRQEFLKQIKSYKFAVIELALYLDTHVDDAKAICLHNKYCKELKDLCDKYQKAFGPLTIEYPCNKWRWVEEPWPWEGGMN